MSNTTPQSNETAFGAIRRRRWLGLPVTQPAKGTLTEILKDLPQFGRQPFTMSSVNGLEVLVNPYLDMIYRLPVRQGDRAVPVGVVSKNYRLVDHHQILRTIEEVIADFGIDPSEINVRAEWTAHGERARFSLLFPSEERFSVRLGEDDEMRFRIEIFNSVEGSCRLMAVAGWLRFVCTNGLILGTALLQINRQHRQQLQIEELGRLLRDALHSAAEDQRTLEEWRSMSITPNVLQAWVNDEVQDKWGLKGAIRVLAISLEPGGTQDAEPKGDLKNKLPSEVSTEKTVEVPGIHPPIADAFGISQALTWVAGQRNDLQEDLEWRTQVPQLMSELLQRAAEGHSLI